MSARRAGIVLFAHTLSHGSFIDAGWLALLKGAHAIFSGDFNDGIFSIQHTIATGGGKKRSTHTPVSNSRTSLLS